MSAAAIPRGGPCSVQMTLTSPRDDAAGSDSSDRARLVLPLALLVVWQAWGMAQSHPRVPLPTRVVANAGRP